jgi:acyl-[acyl-carrier-protein]-phospholipid O-acyltransferase / long-chain-fatty-acid--[acyl-carrier-protein] ligase
MNPETITEAQTGWQRFGLKLLQMIYRVEVSGVEALPFNQQGVLLVCNHVSYVDAIILQMASPRRIRFLTFEEFYRTPFLGWILRYFRTIPVSSRRAKDALVKAAAALQSGEVVCIFPEGQLTQSGDLQELQRGFELIAARAKVPVLPVYLGSLWDSIFSYQGGYAFWKWPRRLPFPVQVCFGQAIPHEQADVERVRRDLLELRERLNSSRMIQVTSTGGKTDECGIN